MSGAGNYCCTDSAVPQSAAGAGPRSSTGLGEGVGGGGAGDTTAGGVVAPDPRAFMKPRTATRALAVRQPDASAPGAARGSVGLLGLLSRSVWFWIEGLGRVLG